MLTRVNTGNTHTRDLRISVEFSAFSLPPKSKAADMKKVSAKTLTFNLRRRSVSMRIYVVFGRNVDNSRSGVLTAAYTRGCAHYYVHPACCNGQL